MLSACLPARARALLAAAALALSGACSWGAGLEGVLSPGDLVQGHAKAEADCNNCHVRFKKTGQDELCLKCHKEVGRDIEQKSGFHGRIQSREPCRSCHADHKGRAGQVVELDEKKFDHRQSDFLLSGSHASVECAKCHLARTRYRDARTTCVACHRKDDDDQKKKGHHGALGDKCDECHTVKKWKDTFFDHDKTRFPLRDAHADARVACADCHANNRFGNTPAGCYACHRKDDDDPGKKGHQGKYGEKCGKCHTEKNWETDRFDHGRDTKYPLRFKHAEAKVKCAGCHTTGWVYRDKLGTDCYACHKKDDKHKGSEGEKCGKCHSERGWKETHDFDHDRTRFPLADAHASPKVRCEDCHTTKVYGDAPKACYGCHRKDDDDPRRKAHHGRYGEKCDGCHTAKDWKTLRFDHDRDTKYALLGRHRVTRCDDCHSGIDLYRDRLGAQCIDCHRKDDKHNGREGERCADCHVEQDWKTTRNKFDHGLSAFPLLGKHVKVDCAGCHRSLDFKAARTQCDACHEKDDRHRQRLGTVCEDCHNAIDWKRWDFRHEKRTRFVLDGGHARIGCYACHRLPAKARALLPMTCFACHRNDDAHSSGYGPQCERCHLTGDWRSVRRTLGALCPKPGAACSPGAETAFRPLSFATSWMLGGLP